MTDLLDFDFAAVPDAAPAGNPDRFTARWRLVGAGLSNVWRYGDLELAAPSGRLLLRGPNGTGKTTALEALWPYLLDLDAARLVAGKARSTTLKQLMSEGARSRGRRYGYAWLSFAPPQASEQPDPMSYGVRLQYSPTSSPAVQVVPFRAPGRPLRELPLTTCDGGAIEHDEFRRRVEELGGEVFDGPEGYLEDLASRVWNTSPVELRGIAQRMRQVRNPALLGDVSPAAAAEALRRSLPGVPQTEITATAAALSESETTRQAFERDRAAAKVLDDFLRVWTGHIVESSAALLTAAQKAAEDTLRLRAELARVERNAEDASARAATSREHVERLEKLHAAKDAEVRAIEQSAGYKAIGAIRELERQLGAERTGAQIAARSLKRSAETAASRTAAARESLDAAVKRLEALIDRAAEAGADTVPAQTLLRHRPQERRIRSAGDTIADPGPGLVVHHDADALDQLTAGWSRRAAADDGEAATAAMLLKDHVAVETAATTRKKTAEALAEADARLAEERQALADATARARGEAEVLLGAAGEWAAAHPRLRAVDPGDLSVGYEWDADDVTLLQHDGEPAAVLAAVGVWADHANVTAARLAAAHEAAASSHAAQAAKLDDEADGLAREAEELRSGKLLPLPRPSWAGEGDDDAALGSILEWLPDVLGPERDRIESALAASGLLSAHLDDDAEGGPTAVTPAWRVHAAGPPAAHSLQHVLTVDGTHPAAEAARAILARVSLAETAEPASGTGIVIGRDGTFAAGVTAGDPVQAELHERGAVPEAQYVGARTRRERALAQADRLEARAAQLHREATDERAASRAEHDAAQAVGAERSTFPSQEKLRAAETHRAISAEHTKDRQKRRNAAAQTAEAAAAEHLRLFAEWSTRARALGMPVDIGELTDLDRDRRARSTALKNAAVSLGELRVTELSRALAAAPDEEELDEQLARDEDEARQAYTTVQRTTAVIDEVKRDSNAADVIRRHSAATEARAALAGSLAAAKTQSDQHRENAAAARALVGPAENSLNESLPLQAETRQKLSALLGYPPVAAVLDSQGFLESRGHAAQEGLEPGPELLDDVAQLLAGKQAFTRRTVRERYDEARARLAQSWTLSPADPPAGLDIEVYALTDAEDTYSLPDAAARALQLATHAEKALAEAEADALEKFVIGRLPNAIGAAWTDMQTWKNEVNAKMRSAQASSGVGVQVRITLKEDLDTTTRVVHRISCEVSGAVRTDEQKRQVGEAIATLLRTADGDTMAERVAHVIDITEWVDVRYLIERPGQNPRVWGSRTALSGGERRLVVLAPMLAAIAANYDRLGAAGLRLVPLDEVPAEVDERGREGLARYMAELDLDLLCTSYLWDGAPGAWDGIDAWDLESGSDGTVVAFPMLIRGTGGALPDDMVPHGREDI